MSPGLIDIHNHGQAGLDVMSEDPEDLLKLSELYATQGVAGFLATFISSAREDIIRSLETIKRIWGTEKGARILGVHLEGPFIHPERLGTHRGDLVRPPTVAEATEWLAAGEGLVKLVTLAPELPGAPDVVRFLLDKGVRVSMGHTAATFEQARAAKALGVSSVTHLFNAMNPLHHRAPGLVGFALLDRDLYTEIIADGVHLNDETVRLVIKSRPADRVILITDSFVLSKTERKKIDWGGIEVTVFPDGSLRKPDGTLSGSNITLREAVDRVVGLGVVPEPQVVAMASTNPLRMLGLEV